MNCLALRQNEISRSAAVPREHPGGVGQRSCVQVESLACSSSNEDPQLFGHFVMGNERLERLQMVEGDQAGDADILAVLDEAASTPDEIWVDEDLRRTSACRGGCDQGPEDLSRVGFQHGDLRDQRVGCPGNVDGTSPPSHPENVNWPWGNAAGDRLSL